MEKRRNYSLGAISPLFHNIFLPVVRFSCLAGTRFSLRNKRLFEISEVEITSVSCRIILLSYILHFESVQGNILQSEEACPKYCKGLYQVAWSRMLSRTFVVRSSNLRDKTHLMDVKYLIKIQRTMIYNSRFIFIYFHI